MVRGNLRPRVGLVNARDASDAAGTTLILVLRRTGYALPHLTGAFCCSVIVPIRRVEGVTRTVPRRSPSAATNRHQLNHASFQAPTKLPARRFGASDEFPHSSELLMCKHASVGRYSVRNRCQVCAKGRRHSSHGTRKQRSGTWTCTHHFYAVLYPVSRLARSVIAAL